MTDQMIAQTFASWITIAEYIYGHSGRGCALAGRDPFGPGACKACSATVAIGG